MSVESELGSGVPWDDDACDAVQSTVRVHKTVNTRFRVTKEQQTYG